MTALDTTQSVSTDFHCPDCSPFLNWDIDQFVSEYENIVVFESLVTTLKLQAELDDSLEAKAVNVLEFVTPDDRKSADDFVSSHGRAIDDSSSNFVQSIVVLISSTSQAITTAAMKMLYRVFWLCSAGVRYPLVQADLIPQLIMTLHPQSLSFVETEDIHTSLMGIITTSLSFASAYGLTELEIKNENEQQAVHETVFLQVIVPSEKYIRHMCVNRFSIVDSEQSTEFMTLLTRLLQISPSYQPTMDFVLNMPIFATIPSCLTFFGTNHTIWAFLYSMVDIQQKWNEKGGYAQFMWKNVQRLLRTEGSEDVMEEKLRNDKNEYFGRYIVDDSIKWGNLLGMNLPQRE
ncbi:hypothetical protein BLNAU_20767 [Blattamonas nauphoetae]|uniref:Uncharacterized protein n=1 Tax=Blattamonas nauphoetae TaxID=2049346 RepID=A0ABQ9X018_9EUKA|nr:hypothetical protein BLNAU_20767 [Blattamonas nauphoetae]